VRRCDDTMGELLGVVDELGISNETLVVFLSDNGPAFPFAKASCYPNGVRTPLIVRWPGHVAEGEVVSEPLVAAIDLMPTLLEAASVELPAGLDGSSFWSFCRGEVPDERGLVFAQYGRTSSDRPFPMRAVQDARFGYVFNPWSDGVREFSRAEHKSNGSYQAMKQAAASDPALASRMAHLQHRGLEELYDYELDPHALRNLVDDPAHAGDLRRLRGELEAWMVRTEDPALEAFRNRHSPSDLRAFMAGLEKAGGTR
jgi:N-sulfoglucosamine sulfohydrolase